MLGGSEIPEAAQNFRRQGRRERELTAYLCGTSQEGMRLRTELGKQRVLARRGWAGEKVGIFSSRLQVADGALKNRNLRHRIAGCFEFCTDLIFKVGRVSDTVDQEVEKAFDWK
jgi:hypothetical protein